MNRGVKLPAGEWATDRSAEKFRVPKRLGLAMANLIFTLSPIEAAVPVEKPVEEPTFCEEKGHLCLMARLLAPDMPVRADTPSEAIPAVVTTTTTTTIPTTTTTRPPLSCERVKQYLLSEVPPAPGWRIECAPPGEKCTIVKGGVEEKVVCDGYAMYDEKIIRLSFESNDSTHRRLRTGAHEVKHSWQADSGEWTGGEEPHNAPELERDADAFANSQDFPDY